MRPLHLKVPVYSKFHIDARNEEGKCFSNPWHFHDELELTFIIKSNGTKFIGDHISNFEPGEIILLGSRLPHYWRNSSAYYQNLEHHTAEAIIIRFNQDFAGSEFLKIPPMKPILDLLQDAKRGIFITGETNKVLQNKMTAFLIMNESQKIIGLIDILLTIASQKEYNFLCSIGYAHQYKSTDIDKIDVIYDYVLENYMNELSVKDIATRCNMNTAAFCRYFKKKTGKTFKDFMNEIRLGNASRLLIKGDLTIAEIAFNSGFNNPSYFNRLFKRWTGLTPTNYQLEYINSN